MNRPKNILINFIILSLLVVIAGCTYYSHDVKRIAKKYSMSKEAAKRCYSVFNEDTEFVLDWVKDNKSWFFGLFSENCDDLIAQLPPFGNAENLLAAKENKWTADDLEYKNFLEKRKQEKLLEDLALWEKEWEEREKLMTTGKLVKKEDFGEKWPFTVESGYLDCVAGSAVFRSGMTEYGLNGTATSRGYTSVDRIWRADPGIPGAKIYIGEMIALACQ